MDLGAPTYWNPTTQPQWYIFIVFVSYLFALYFTNTVNIPLIFMPAYYLRIYPDVAQSREYGGDSGSKNHFKKHGVKEGRSPSVFFDPKYYEVFYPDVPQFFGAGQWLKFWEHWNKYGVKEGRRGSPIFDPRFYLAEHADVRRLVGERNFGKGYEHWVVYGIQEGRRSVPELDGPFLQNTSPYTPTAVAAAALASGTAARAMENSTIVQLCRGLANQVSPENRDFIFEHCVRAHENVLRERERLEGRDHPFIGEPIGGPGASDLPSHDNIG